MTLIGVMATAKANTYNLYIRCVVSLGLPLLIKVGCPSIISQWLSLIKATSVIVLRLHVPLSEKS